MSFSSSFKQYFFTFQDMQRVKYKPLPTSERSVKTTRKKLLFTAGI